MKRLSMRTGLWIAVCVALSAAACAEGVPGLSRVAIEGYTLFRYTPPG